MHTLVDEIIATAEQVEQEMKQADRVESLKESVKWGFLISEKREDQRNVRAYCGVLVANKGLGAKFWEEYARAMMKDVANGAVSREEADKILRAMMRAGSIGIASGIANCPGEIQNKVCWASDGPTWKICLAARNYYTFWESVESGGYATVELWLRKSKLDPEVYGELDITANGHAAIKLASRKGHRRVVSFLLKEMGADPEVYDDRSAAFEDAMNYWASQEE